jgi:hypothetical protein
MPRNSRPSARPRMSRRTLVRRGLYLGAGVGVSAGGLLLWGHARRYPAPQPSCELLFLQAREFAILTALADTIFPAGNPLGISGRDARVPEYVDRMLARMPSDKAAEFEAMLLLFEHGTLAFGLRIRRFTALPPAAAERYLRRWEEAQVYSRRMLAAGLKTLLGIGYFAHPEVQQAMGIQKICATSSDALPRQEWS